MQRYILHLAPWHMVRLIALRSLSATKRGDVVDAVVAAVAVVVIVVAVVHEGCCCMNQSCCLRC